MNEMGTMPEWVILQRAGMVPERKGPYSDPKWVAIALRELYAQYPDCVCIVIQMPSICYPQSGHEWLSIHCDTENT